MHGAAAVQIGHHIFHRDLEDRALASRKGRADDLVYGVPIGSLRIFTYVHIGKALGSPAQLGNSRIGESEGVEGHIAFALMVPFIDHPPAGNPGGVLLGGQAVVVVMDLRHHPFEYRVAMRYGVGPVGCMPDRHGIFEYLFPGAHGVQQTPVADHLVVVIDVIGVVQHAAGGAVFFQYQGGVGLVQFQQMALQQGPFRRCRNLCGDHCRFRVRSGHTALLRVARWGDLPPSGRPIEL